MSLLVLNSKPAVGDHPLPTASQSRHCLSFEGWVTSKKLTVDNYVNIDCNKFKTGSGITFRQMRKQNILFIRREKNVPTYLESKQTQSKNKCNFHKFAEIRSWEMKFLWGLELELLCTVELKHLHIAAAPQNFQNIFFHLAKYCNTDIERLHEGLRWTTFVMLLSPSNPTSWKLQQSLSYLPGKRTPSVSAGRCKQRANIATTGRRWNPLCHHVTSLLPLRFPGKLSGSCGSTSCRRGSSANGRASPYGTLVNRAASCTAASAPPTRRRYEARGAKLTCLKP